MRQPPPPSYDDAMQNAYPPQQYGMLPGQIQNHQNTLNDQQHNPAYPPQQHASPTAPTQTYGMQGQFNQASYPPQQYSNAQTGTPKHFTYPTAVVNPSDGVHRQTRRQSQLDRIGVLMQQSPVRTKVIIFFVTAMVVIFPFVIFRFVFSED